MKKKKYAFAIAMGCVYVALSLGLLISLSGAKYTEKRKVYTEGRAAKFDAAILLKEADTATDIITLTDLRPGLEGENEKKYPFYVSNGPDQMKTAGVALDYTIRIRTAKTLPLDYFLEEVERSLTGEITGTTRFQAGEPVAVYADGTPVPEDVLNPPQETEPTESTEAPGGEPQALAQEVLQEIRYEYTFYPIPEEPSPMPLSDTDAEVPEQPQEAAFRLRPVQTDGFVKKEHNLVVQWPSSRTEDVRYMKEVEILELLVTAAGMNHLPVETLPSEPLPTESDADAHTRGVIVLDENQAEYEYWVDLRSFVKGTWDGDESWEYSFYVDNGVRYGKEPTSRNIRYEMEIYIPAVRGTTVNDAGETVETFDMLMYSDSHWLLDKERLTYWNQPDKYNNYYLLNEETGVWGTRPYWLTSYTLSNGNKYSYLYDAERYLENEYSINTPYTPDVKEQPYLKRVVQTDDMKIENFEKDMMNNDILKEKRNLHTITVGKPSGQELWDISPYVFDYKILIKVKATFS